MRMRCVHGGRGIRCMSILDFLWVIRVRVQGEFVDHFLRDGKPFDTEGFEVDLAVCHSGLQADPSSALDVVHGAAGDAYDEDEDAENNEQEDPETGEAVAALCCTY